MNADFSEIENRILATMDLDPVAEFCKKHGTEDFYAALVAEIVGRPPSQDERRIVKKELYLWMYGFIRQMTVPEALQLARTVLLT